MEGLIINKEDLAALELWISNIPTKYGMELVIFINNSKKKQEDAIALNGTIKEEEEKQSTKQKKLEIVK